MASPSTTETKRLLCPRRTALGAMWAEYTVLPSPEPYDQRAFFLSITEFGVGAGPL
jgi:hypothetical protein